MIIYTVKVDDKGTKSWYLDGKLHRTDGPAVEGSDGTKHWYLDNKRHRIDGPAIEDVDGSKSWYLHDKLHRVDGPAIEWADGTKEWWLYGNKLTQAQWKRADKPKVTSCVGKVVEVDGVKYRLIAA
jgi:hypothetical protein